jgi:hypothetical protein
LRDPSSKKPFTKRAGGVTQGVGLEFKPQYRKKKKKMLISTVHGFQRGRVGGSQTHLGS